MKHMSVQRNFMFSSILTVSNYIFPFIVYPYVARVLGVNNIGICNFVDSIVNYAVLISLMGITIIGSRNIAKAKADPQSLNRVFTALFLLSLTFTVISTLALLIVTYTVDALNEYRKLLIIGLIKLWGNFLLIDWLYKGLEDFRYITVRTIIVKFAYIVAVFLLVRHDSDYVIYYLLICLMVAVNAAFNCARATKLVKFKFDWNVIKHSWSSFVILGVYLLLNSMYTTFNVTYLGFECGDVEVGFYTTATKIFKIILAIYTAYSTVILPRASALLSQGRTDEFRELIAKSIDGLMLFSIPMIFFCVVFSVGIIDLIAGPQYYGAIIPMMIAMPLLFVIGYEQILVVQILTPLSNDRIILLNSVIGASVGLIGNIALVGHLASIGSAIVWVLAEIAVLIAAQHYVTRATSIRFPFKPLFINICAYLPFVGIGLLIIFFSPLSPIANMFIGMALLVVCVYVAQKFFLRSVIFQLLTDKFMKRHTS